MPNQKCQFNTLGMQPQWVPVSCGIHGPLKSQGEKLPLNVAKVVSFDSA